MRRFLVILALLTACSPQTEVPNDPPANLQRQFDRQAGIIPPPVPEPPPPPPPPDFSYAPVPKAIAAILADPETEVHVVVLDYDSGGGGKTFGPRIETERRKLEELDRARVAALLTSGVTYGHFGGLCTSPGIGFHLVSGKFGEVDVFIEPAEGTVQVLGPQPATCSLSFSGVELFAALQREFCGKSGCV